MNDTVKRIKKQITDWEKIFVNYSSQGTWIHRIQRISKTQKQENNPIK